MMRFSGLKQQRGAILAFSLVMLLLLTLAGTRMIQQNKQQLQIAGNARLVTQAFADTEAVLAAGYQKIKDDFAHKDPTYIPPKDYDLTINPKPQCTPIVYKDVDKKIIGSKQQLLLAGQVLLDKKLPDGSSSKAEIVESWCADKNGTPTDLCTSYDYEKTKIVTCPTLASPENCKDKTIEQVADLFPISAVCYQHYDPNCDDTTYTSSDPLHPCSKTLCPIEVYKIRAISTNANGATREIISAKQIKCDSP